MKNPIRTVDIWLHKYGLFGWNYAYLLTHPWKIVEESYYRIKWFIQRGYRSYADCDVWSLDWYLAKWMPKALRVLRDNKIGHPAGMTMKGWRARLEKMADGFDAAFEIQDYKHKFRSPGERAAYRRFHLGMKLFCKHYFNLWD
jgi:hypothetical protein